MINIPLVKQLIRSNGKFLALFTMVLCAFLVVMCYVFTPETVLSLKGITQETALGHIFGSNGTLIGFMANSFYALMAIIFPMVYSIIVGNRLIAEKVDRGNMATYLATPTSRNTITMTSALYLIISLCVMWGVASLVGYFAANTFQKGALDVDTFLMMNIGCFLYHFVISGICFCASCIFNLSKHSLLVGAGLPIAFFVVNMFLKLSNDLEVLKYMTLNTLFDTQKILEGYGYELDFLIMGCIGILLYIVGIIVFHEKDLPL